MAGEVAGIDLKRLQYGPWRWQDEGRGRRQPDDALPEKNDDGEHGDDAGEACEPPQPDTMEPA